MKLKIFTAENCAAARHGKLSLSISFKTGLLRLNKETCEKLKLKEKDKVAFYQDEEELKDWYLGVGDEKGFELRKKENIGNGLLFNNIEIANKIAESVEFEGTSGSLLLAAEPVKHEKDLYWPLITASLVQKKRKGK